MAVITLALLACQGPAATPDAHFEQAGLITQRVNDRPAEGSFATQVRAGDPFLYVVFVVGAEDEGHRFAVDVDWKQQAKVLQHDRVQAAAGLRAWSLCQACHARGDYTVELRIAGTEERMTIPFTAQ